MKKIGLVGGMSWQSTLMYYKYINEYVEKKNDGLTSTEILISSINFANIEKLQKAKKWKEAEKIIYKETNLLIKCGADIVGICSNTGNECAERIKNKISVPLINIADPIGEYISKNNIHKVGLLGTIHTMEENYIKKILNEKYNIDVFVPNKRDRVYINDTIYKELCKSIISKKTKERYLLIMKQMIKLNNLEAFVLGCTEIPLLIKQRDIKTKIINSTKLHAEYIAQKSLQ